MMQKETEICILTSVHPWDDPRIYQKQARTMAKEYRIMLLAPDGCHGRDDAGIDHKKVPVSSLRTVRILFGWISYLKAALQSGASVCIFHDPELIPAGLLLKLSGRKVVMDIHEQLPLQIMTKTWIPDKIKPIASAMAEKLITYAAVFFDLTIAATPAINNDIGGKGVVIRNFPLWEEQLCVRSGKRSDDVCYLGTISMKRGAAVMISAARQAGVALHLAGTVEDRESWKLIAEGRQKGYIRFYGRLTREEMRRLTGHCRAGLCLLLKEGGYPFSIPTKLFEYPVWGLEVIATDMPYWRKLAADFPFVRFVEERNTAEAAKEIGKSRRIPEEERKKLREKFSWEGEGARLMAALKRL